MEMLRALTTYSARERNFFRTPETKRHLE